MRHRALVSACGRGSCGAWALGLLALAILAPGAEAGSGIKRAEELFKGKDYDRARAEALLDTSTLDRNARDEALLELARCETNARRAETLYRRIVTSPNERAAEEARLELAKMRYATGDYAGVLEALSNGRFAGAGREEAAYFTALSHQQLGDTAEARVAFATISRGRYYPWANLARADIDSREGRVSEAIARYEEIERLRPDPIAHFRLGECYETLGQTDRALELYRDLVDRFPWSLEAGKGREKLQLLTQPRTKRNEPRTAEASGVVKRPAKEEERGGPAERGFTLQFGSFSARDNAVAVAGKLEKLLPAVRIESVEMEGRVFQRVRAGFYENRADAERDLARAQERSGLTGTIVPLK